MSAARSILTLHGAQHLDVKWVYAHLPGYTVTPSFWLQAKTFVIIWLACTQASIWFRPSSSASLCCTRSSTSLHLLSQKSESFRFTSSGLEQIKAPFSLRMLSDIFSSGSVSPPCSLVFTYTRPDVDDRSACWSWFSGKQTVESSVTGVVILNFVIYLSCLWE